jgi:hypothetical protein
MKCRFCDEEYDSYGKDNNIGINIAKDFSEIVLIGEFGDFKHFKVDHDIIYTLIGYMISHRFISVDFKL